MELNTITTRVVSLLFLIDHWNAKAFMFSEFMDEAKMMGTDWKYDLIHSNANDNYQQTICEIKTCGKMTQFSEGR